MAVVLWLIGAEQREKRERGKAIVAKPASTSSVLEQSPPQHTWPSNLVFPSITGKLETEPNSRILLYAYILAWRVSVSVIC